MVSGEYWNEYTIQRWRLNWKLIENDIKYVYFDAEMVNTQ